MTARSFTLALAVLAAAPAFAHHGLTQFFDVSKPLAISGTVTAYEARNPHVYLHIASSEENGSRREYVCEGGGATSFARAGLTPEMLVPGTQLRIQGIASRSDSNRCFFSTVDLGNGKVFRVGAPPRPAETSVTTTGIFGTWLFASVPQDTTGPQPMLAFLTPIGKRAHADYDPFRDAPSLWCDPLSVVRTWRNPATPLSISREGETVVLRYEWMDAQRIVHLSAGQHPAQASTGSLGHSIGHFEGDSLVIDTKYYAPGVLNEYVQESGKQTRGLLHSASLRTIERLRFDEDRQRLTVTIDVADPEYFTRSFDAFEFEFVPTTMSIEPFNCSPEGRP